MKVMKVRVEFVDCNWIKERKEKRQLKQAQRRLKELDKWLHKSPVFKAQYEAIRNPAV